MAMSDVVPDRFRDTLRASPPRTCQFEDDGTFPNNEELPVLLYEQAFRRRGEGNVASSIEAVFEAHEWGGHWRNGIFSYHHYHSTAHEVLGVAAGAARVQLGGPEGEVFDVEQGDVVVLPAGTAHKNVGAEGDFLVVGAYPANGDDWDLKRGRPGERPEADRNIDQVPHPSKDPVYGANGPLLEHWK